MSNLLSVLITFVSVMLVLALAAQSVQEIVKAAFAIKLGQRQKALQGLVVEASRALELTPASAEQIYQDLLGRIRRLGQKAIRSGSIRLDWMTGKDIKELLATVDKNGVDDLKGLAKDAARAQLTKIGEQAEKWFDLAMSPTEERYRRRMRGYGFAASAMIVILLNADAIRIFQQARNDPTFRARVDSIARPLSAQIAVERLLCDSLQAHDAVRDDCQGDSTTAKADSSALVKAWRDSLAATRKVILTQTLEIATPPETFLTGAVGRRRPGEFSWYLGILFSTLLVSLGAPFWHDLLESLFGLKNRIRAEGEQIRSGAGTGSAGVARSPW
jgi:hypothetical protein